MNTAGGYKFPDGNEYNAKNYCKINPNFSNEGPWCYTTDKNTKFEYCNVDYCSKLFEDLSDTRF